MSWPELLLVVAGVGLAVGGVGWKLQTDRRRERAMLRVLVSGDEASRLAVLPVLDSGRIAPYADALMALTGSSTSMALTSSLARLVATHQWEPVDDPGMADLRVWARDWLQAHEAGLQAPVPPAGDLPPYPQSGTPAGREVLDAAREALASRNPTRLRLRSAAGVVAEVGVVGPDPRPIPYREEFRQ